MMFNAFIFTSNCHALCILNFNIPL
jgi:hypothetical protein